MSIEVIRKGNAVTRLTVNKQRITIKLAQKDDNSQIIEFLSWVGQEIQQDDTILVTMRGALEGTNLVMRDDLKSIARDYDFGIWSL